MSAASPDEVRGLVVGYATRLGLPERVMTLVARGPAAVEAADFWRVETHVWWERRLYRYKGALETGMESSRVFFGSLSLRADALADRWSHRTGSRPEDFSASERVLQLDAPAGGGQLELVVRFGTHVATQSFGEPRFPIAFAGQLPVQARFQGVDSVPMVESRRAAPYRENNLPGEHPGIPTHVMRAVREFVREIDLPGYSERIHGWRTLVQGGPVFRVRFEGVRVEGEPVTALVLPHTGAVYAPELSSFVS